MDHPDLTVSNFKGNSIGTKMVNMDNIQFILYFLYQFYVCKDQSVYKMIKKL